MFSAGPFKRGVDGEEALTLLDDYNVTLSGGPGGSRVCKMTKQGTDLTQLELANLAKNGKIYFNEAAVWFDMGAAIFHALPLTCYSANKKYVTFTGCTAIPDPPLDCTTPTGYSHQNDWLYASAAQRGDFELWTNGLESNWDTYWADLGVSSGDTAKYYE